MILAAGVLELTESAEQMMVVWDDLFANLDDAHLDFVRGLISAISARRQVIVTTRDLRLGEWGACIDLEQAFRHLELSPQA